MSRARRFASAGIVSCWLGGVLIALTLAVSARAATNPWTPFGPGGGGISSLAVDPRSAAVVYAVAGPQSGGPGHGTLYKSTDGGITWKGLTGSGLQVVALAPDSPLTIYTGGLCLLRSTNGGQSWSTLTLPVKSPLINALAVAPGGVVFVGSRSQLLRSPDGGRTWAVVAQDALDVTAIVVDPANPRRVYHASQNRLLKSEDGGVRWSPTGQPPYGGIAALAVAPSNPDRLYLRRADDSSVYRSDDGARTWRSVGGRTGSQHQALLVDPRSPDHVYAASDFGVYASVDGGNVWNWLYTGLPISFYYPPPVFSLALAPSHPDTLFAGTSEVGVGRSMDSGAHWRFGLENGLSAANPTLLKFHPLRPQTVYLGQATLGTRSFRSTDGGRSWQAFAQPVTAFGWHDLAFDPVDPDILYLATESDVWKSADGGGSWSKVHHQRFLQLATVDRQTLLGAGCGAWRSADDGETWQEVIPCQEAAGYPQLSLSLWVDPRNSHTVYAHFFLQAGEDSRFEVFKSTDGGVTWATLPGLDSPTLLAVAPGDFRTLYAAEAAPDLQSATLLRSLDGGASWKVVNRHLPLSLGSFLFSNVMVVDAADPSTLYVAANPLLISHDGGVTFRPGGGTFEFGKRQAGLLWTDRASPGLLYAGAADGGLFVGRIQ